MTFAPQSDTFNPYQAPKHSVLATEKTTGVLSSVAWLRWIVIGALVQLGATTLAIYLDSRGNLVDSGLWCVWGSAIAQAMICLIVGLRHETRTAIRLSLVVNSIVWLTLIATASVAVPQLLGPTVPLSTVGIFLSIWAAGMPVSALIAWCFARLRHTPSDSGGKFANDKTDDH